MLASLIESLTSWHQKNDDRTKLQQLYIILAVALLLLAGVIGLINHELGQSILAAAIVMAGLFLVNAVAWSLLQSAILSRIPKRTNGTSRTKK